MTVLLYDYLDLEERAGRHLKVWKVWHLILFSMAVVFGVVNYIVLQSAMQLVDDNCVLYPRELNFHMVLRLDDAVTNLNDTDVTTQASITESTLSTLNGTQTLPANITEKVVEKRETGVIETMDNFETTMEIENVTVVTGNKTHQLMLDTSRTLFARASDCQFAEYMPVMSTVVALVWVTLFTMCPGGGRPRSGLKQPWRILTPALLSALVVLGLTAHSFARTNGGLHAFCAAFYNVTNSTTCSSVDPFLELGRNSSWGFGSRAAAARAASAAVWAAWACVAALLLARCLAAPDFEVKKTGVFLVKDPEGKLTPYIRRSMRSQRSPPATPSTAKPDNTSIRSDPTFTTELATATVEPGQPIDSTSTSQTVTPIKKEKTDMIEMTVTPEDKRLSSNEN